VRGAKVINRLAADLRREFPDMTGLSLRNLRYMRAFARAWPAESPSLIVQRPVAQLPWAHYADVWVMPICLPDLALGAVIAA